jgi:hypothetical protein
MIGKEVSGKVSEKLGIREGEEGKIEKSIQPVKDVGGAFLDAYADLYDGVFQSFQILSKKG